MLDGVRIFSYYFFVLLSKFVLDIIKFCDDWLKFRWGFVVGRFFVSWGVFIRFIIYKIVGLFREFKNVVGGSEVNLFLLVNFGNLIF